MQSLYLFPERPVSLTLDGPSLLLVAPGLAPRRYPFRRLSNIVLGGAVQVEARTLAECLQRKISLTFLDGVSGLAGIALPSVPETPNAQQRIEDLLSTPDWDAFYSNWLRAAARSHLLTALSRAGWTPPSHLHDHDVSQSWLARLSSHALTSDEVRNWIAFDHGLLASRCSRFLSGVGVDPCLLAAGPVLAPSDWLAVLGWHSYAEVEWLLARLGPLLKSVRQNWRRRLTEFAETRKLQQDQRIAVLWADFLSFASLRIQKSRQTFATE